MTALAEIFGPGGRLARRLPGFEHRAAQLAMAETVAKAIEAPETLICEARTGTGKTFAYLVPVWAAVTSTTDNCLGQSCPDLADCRLAAARREAGDASQLAEQAAGLRRAALDLRLSLGGGDRRGSWQDFTAESEPPRALAAPLRRWRTLHSILRALAGRGQGLDARLARAALLVARLEVFTAAVAPDQPRQALWFVPRGLPEPSDPGYNPFAEVQLPQAVIALKQGAGRLIRGAGDRGGWWCAIRACCVVPTGTPSSPACPRWRAPASPMQ